MEYLTIYRMKRGYGRPPRWAQRTRARLALVGCAPLGAPPGAALAHQESSGPTKIHKKFRGVWTPFNIDFLRCKKSKKQQLALGTGSIG